MNNKVCMYDFMLSIKKKQFSIKSVKTVINNKSGLLPANERRRYKVTPSLIGWAQT